MKVEHTVDQPLALIPLVKDTIFLHAGGKHGDMADILSEKKTLFV